MSSLAEVSWRVVVVLGTIALVRPLLSITGLADDWGRPETPIAATVVISTIWVVAGALVRRPVETLVLTGLTYGLLALVLSAILSPILDGELGGPLTHPVAPFALMAVNATWGAACGLLGWGVRGLRHRSDRC